MFAYKISSKETRGKSIERVPLLTNFGSKTLPSHPMPNGTAAQLCDVDIATLVIYNCIFRPLESVLLLLQ